MYWAISENVRCRKDCGKEARVVIKKMVRERSEIKRGFLRVVCVLSCLFLVEAVKINTNLQSKLLRTPPQTAMDCH